MDLSSVGDNLTSVIGWIGKVVNALTATDGALAALLPLLMVGVSISALMLSIKVIRSFIWGA